MCRFSWPLHTHTSLLRFHRQNEFRRNTAWTVVLSLLVNNPGNSARHMKSSSIVKISINTFKKPWNRIGKQHAASAQHRLISIQWHSSFCTSALPYGSLWILMDPYGLMGLSPRSIYWADEVRSSSQGQFSLSWYVLVAVQAKGLNRLTPSHNRYKNSKGSVDVFFTYFDSLFGLKICDFRVPAHPISPSNQPIQARRYDHHVTCIKLYNIM